MVRVPSWFLFLKLYETGDQLGRATKLQDAPCVSLLCELQTTGSATSFLENKEEVILVDDTPGNVWPSEADRCKLSSL